jgi:hypothetical protein
MLSIVKKTTLIVRQFQPNYVLQQMLGCRRTAVRSLPPSTLLWGSVSKGRLAESQARVRQALKPKHHHRDNHQQIQPTQGSLWGLFT